MRKKHPREEGLKNLRIGPIQPRRIRLPRYAPVAPRRQQAAVESLGDDFHNLVKRHQRFAPRRLRGQGRGKGQQKKGCTDHGASLAPIR